MTTAKRMAGRLPCRWLNSRGLNILTAMIMVVVLLGIHTGCGPPDKPVLIVYSAASTTLPVAEVSRLFTEKTGIPIENSFASSSMLRKKIEQAAGKAGIDIFLSANLMHMDALKQTGFIDRNTARIIMRNSLVLIVSRDNPAAPQRIEDIVDLDLTPVAMGDPQAKVPCGMYAEEALRSLGLWMSLHDRTTREITVRAALARVEQGICPAGIVYASDALSSRRVRVAFTFPETAHSPILYPVALVTGSDNQEEARKYLEFLISGEAGQVFVDHGFTPIKEGETR